MQTQRDLEESYGEAAKKANRDLQSFLTQLYEAYLGENEIVAALRDASSAFDTYRASQIDLISASTDGSVAGALRNASYEQITMQRLEVLRAFVRDTRPDLAIAGSDSPSA